MEVVNVLEAVNPLLVPVLLQPECRKSRAATKHSGLEVHCSASSTMGCVMQDIRSIPKEIHRLARHSFDALLVS